MPNSMALLFYFSGMRQRNMLLSLLLILALIPYLVTCLYALPFADDYCYGWTASAHTSFLHKFLKQYLHWNGRYTSDLIVNLHPITTGNLLLCQSVLASSIIATAVILFIFIRSFLKDSWTSAIVALFITLFNLCYQPNITEGIYWYIGIANYQWADLCLILQLIFFMRTFSAEDKVTPPALAISLLLLISAVGFNEVIAFLIPFYYFAAFIINPKMRDKRTQIVLLHFGVALVASAFVFLSPGNFTRQQAFANKFNAPHSLLFSLLQTIRFTGKWTFTTPLLLLSIAVVALADKVRHNIAKIDARFILLLLFFTVFAGSFFPYMATGILGQHRTIDLIFLPFIILWLWALVSVSQRYALHQKLSALLSARAITAICVTGIAIMLITGNSVNIITDLKQGRFVAYKNEFMQRQTNIIQDPTAPIVPLKNIPSTFTIVDVKTDTISFVNECMYKFYTQTGIEIH